MITERHDFVLPITTDQTLKDFVQLAFGVTIPDTQVCPNHSTPFKAFSDAYFAKSPVSVWKASRALGGKTFLLSLLSLTEALTLKIDISLLGGSGEQSKRALESITRFTSYANAPRHLLKSEVSRETSFAWGNHIEALMASQASVRGPHPARLRCDEVDEMDKAILDSALGQPMLQHGVESQIVKSSTHQYSDGTMAAVLKEAAEKNQPVFEWCYKETLEPHGWLTHVEMERKKSQMTAASWENEVELQEPSPGSRAILTDAVAAMFKRELGSFAGSIRESIEIEPPQPGAKYCHGADWAKEQDKTILLTMRIDCRPMRVVSFMAMQRENYPAMVGEFKKRLKRYGGQSCHDNTGLGDVVDDLLEGTGTLGINMIGQVRSDLLSEYIKAIENHEIVSPYIRLMEAEHRQASVQDVYSGGRKYHLPDTISAGALMYRASKVGGWVRGMGK
jgi:hypothetical protein